MKAPSVAFAALLLAGCYSPQLASPGFRCRVTDNPACPDGQRCVNGVCQSGSTTGGHHNNPDFGSSSNPDFGSSSNPDFSTGTHPDLSNPGNTSGKTGCLGELMCVNNCAAGDSTCVSGCQANATPQGDQLLQSLIACVQSACPTDPGAPCDGTDPTLCDSCVMSAQSTGGQCESAQMACANSTP